MNHTTILNVQVCHRNVKIYLTNEPVYKNLYSDVWLLNEVPEEYNIEFKPLWNLNEKEEAEVSKIKIDAEKVEVDNLVSLYGVGALTSDEIRNYINKKDKYDIEGE